MKTVDMTDQEVTVVTVFEMPVSRIGEFADSWRADAEPLRAAPGFREVWLHRSIDAEARFPVVAVAHWDSAEQVVAEDIDILPAEVHASSATYETVHDFRSPEGRVFTGPGVTFMNIFEIEPGVVTEFAADWADRARHMQRSAGFRNVRLHRSLTSDARFRLVNVAHWDSVQVWRKAAQSSPMTAATEAARAQATPNTAIYEVVTGFGATPR